MKTVFHLIFVFALVLTGCAPSSQTPSEQSTQEPQEIVQELAPMTLPLINPKKAQIPEELPSTGPYVHSVWVASSTDGLNFTDDFDQPLAEHVSVPTAMSFDDGTIRTYFVDVSGGQEVFTCIESMDGGETYSFGDCSLGGLTRKRAVDYSIVALDDGRYRLYFYAFDEEVDSKTMHQIDSAISTDGVHFEREGTVFTYEGLVDPDVFWNGSEWVMHVFSNSGTMGTVVATSEDGLNFEYKGMLSPAKYGVTKPLTLEDGSFRMYGFKQPWAESFASLISSDGFDWSLEEGTRFTVETGNLITDPFVIQLEDGTYKMFYKLEPAAGRAAAK